MNHSHSHRLITRRDFLSQGLIGFSGWIAAQSLSGLGMREAWAASRTSPTPLPLPFLVFDMAGGAALPGNFLVGKQGGARDLLASYDRLGWDPRAPGALHEGFGLPMAASASQLLKGIVKSASSEALKNLRMGSICNASQDDSPANKLNAATLLVSAGLRGRHIITGLGIIKSDSGGNSASALEDIRLKPTAINSVDDIIASTQYGGSTFKMLKRAELASLAQGTVALGKIQKDLYRSSPEGALLAELAAAAYEGSAKFVSGVQGLDPRVQPEASAVYGLTDQSSAADGVAAAIAMNSLLGNCGPGVWTLGGCDYHDNTQATGDAKDLEMGTQIGKAVELAYRLKRPLFFQLLTDGGVEATQGTRQWRGDAGDKSMTVMGFFHPTQTPRLIREQVGHYTDGQGVERSTLIGGNPQLAAYAVLANFLNCCGKLSLFHELLPSAFAGAGELDSVLVFEAPERSQA
jgi:hypothetical protein